MSEQPAVRPGAASDAADLVDRVVANLGLVVRAPVDVLRLPVLCLLGEGHVLIEDFPGVGKTVLAKSLARSLELSFSRIQFTPDLLPSDVTGVNVFDQRTGEFAFRPGPVFANVLLVDEVNRASPKTQSALLEAMQETQVTIDGETLSARPPVFGARHAKPRRVRGHVPATRSPARPLLGADGDRIPAARRRGPHAGRADDRPAARRPTPCRRARRGAGGGRGGARECTSRRASNRYVVALLRHTRGERPSWRSARALRAGIALLRIAKARALAERRDYSSPRTYKASPAGPLPPLDPRSRGALGRHVTPADAVREAVAGTPAPV